MNYEVFITAAVTGGGATTHKSDKVPVTPKEIADAAAEAQGRGGHCPLPCARPKDGRSLVTLHMYKEVVDRIATLIPM